jgi:hypothetical protein
MKILSFITGFGIILSLLSCGSFVKEPAEKLGDSMIQNGDFLGNIVTNCSDYDALPQKVKDDLSYRWALLTVNQTKSSVEIESNVCRVIPEKTNGITAAIKLTYFPCRLKFAEAYKVSFDVKTDKIKTNDLSYEYHKTILFKVGRIGGDFLAYSGYREYSVNPVWQTISFVFRSTGTDDFARLEFDCASDSTPVYFRDITLKQVLK